MRLRYQTIVTVTGAAFTFGACIVPVAAQIATPESCASFNSLSEKHANNAREITTKAQEQSKLMPTADAEKFNALNKAGADSEWEMSALARDAYRKCMQDYLAGGSTPPQQPAAAAPTQQQPAQQQTVQRPVQQTQPAKQVQQQKTQQKARVQPKQQAVRTTAQPQPEPQQTYQPVLPGLLGIGIGIGLGGYR